MFCNLVVLSVSVFLCTCNLCFIDDDESRPVHDRVFYEMFVVWLLSAAPLRRLTVRPAVRPQIKYVKSYTWLPESSVISWLPVNCWFFDKTAPSWELSYNLYIIVRSIIVRSCNFSQPAAYSQIEKRSGALGGERSTTLGCRRTTDFEQQAYFTEHFSGPGSATELLCVCVFVQ